MKTLFLICLVYVVLLSAAQAQPLSVGNADKLQAETVELFNQGKYQGALEMAKQTISLREKELGKHHPKVANDLSNLAAIFYTLGNFSEVEHSYEKALKIYESAQPQDEESIIRVLNRLAACAEEITDRQPPNNRVSAGRAAKLYQRSLALTEKRYGPEHPEVGVSLTNLGRNLSRFKQDSEAEAAFKRAIQIIEKASGPNDRRLAEPLEGTACLLMNAKKVAEAAPLHSRVNFLLQQLSPNKSAPIVFPFKIFTCRAIAKSHPGYPAEAKSQGAMGRVVVQVEIDEAGNVVMATSPFPNRALANASIEAAKKWRFKPALVNQTPVRMSAYLTFNFFLQ